MAGADERKPLKTERVVALVTINGADDFSPKGRKAVAKWIRKQADFLERYPAKIGKRITSRYLCPK